MGSLPLWSRAWDAAIQATVHEVAITFGFQLFSAHPKPQSLDPGEPRYVPSTCSVAAEHLLRQVRDNFFRQSINKGDNSAPGGTDYDNIQAAVKDLHDEMLAPFQVWQQHVALPHVEHGVNDTLWLVQLAELALLFLLYTEASSLRHTPELMWLIYWVMQNSRRFEQVIQALHQTSTGRPSRRPLMWIEEQPELHQREWWVQMGASLPAVRKYLRNSFLAADLRQLGERFVLDKAQAKQPYLVLNSEQHFKALTREVEDLIRAKAAQASQSQALGMKSKLEQLLQWLGAEYDGLLLSLLAETAALDEGSLFLDQVVQPFFTYLTQQVFKMGHDGVDASRRVAYDDVNESCTVPEAVQGALEKAGILQAGRGKRQVRGDVDAYECLISAGLTASSFRYELTEEQAEKEAGLKAVWWGNNLFKKTFMERRVPLMVFRAFFRVYVFLAVYFHLLLALAFSDERNELLTAISTVSMTHCAFMLVNEVSSLFVIQPLRAKQPKVANSMTEKKEPALVVMHGYRKALWRHCVGLLTWLLLLLALVFLFVNRKFKWVPALERVWWWVSWGYIYTVLVTETLRHTIAGYTLSSLGDLLLGRTSADQYMASRSNLQTSQARYLPNALMWLCVFAIKVPLDFYAILKPLEDVFDTIMSRRWLIYSVQDCVELPLRCNQFSFNWVLAVILLAPAFLTVLYDTGIIYQVVSAAFGTAYGLLWQRLGQVRRWDGLVTSFLTAPHKWGAKCISKGGMRSLKNQLRRQKVLQRSATSRSGQRLPTFGAGAGGPGATQRRPQMSYNASLLRGPAGVAVDEAVSALVEKTAYSEEELMRVAPQLAFMAPWNSLIDDMRQRDLLSNKEMKALLYQPLSDNFQARQTDQAAGPSTTPHGKGPTMSAMDESSDSGLLPSESAPPASSTSRPSSGSGPVNRFSMVAALGALRPGKRKPTVPTHPTPDPEAPRPSSDASSTLYPYLLPKAMAAGVVYETLRTFSASRTQLEIVRESYQWLLWLANSTGLINDRQETILKLLQLPARSKTTTQEKDREALLSSIVALLEVLPTEKQLGSWKKLLEDKGQAGGGSRAVGLLKGDAQFQAVAGKVKEAAKKVLDGALKELALARQDHTKAGINRAEAENALKEMQEQQSEVVDRVAHAVLFMCRINMGENYGKVVGWLLETLTKAEGDAVPENKEAQRILYFFLSSLYNPLMPRAPSIHHMKSLTTLTPHYEETVMFGLDPLDAQRLLDFSPNNVKEDDKTYLFDTSGKPTGTLRYLHTVFAEDWKNFCERMKEEAKELKIDLGGRQHISEFDFLHGQALHPLRHELLMWACLRGQPLARTVRGMMAYQDALNILAKVEYPKPSDMSAEAYEVAIAELVDTKFSYCVTSQVFGGLIANDKDLTKRWTARGIEALMMMFPKLQIAYVDTQKTGGGRSRQWSILLTPGEPLNKESASRFALENIPKKPGEVYRVRLPINYAGNRGVVLGEGKPENQNHAIIFCFGECVQTIDMNQDNVLAEAFKVRNLLAEFQDPHVAQEVALVGFREWIISQDLGALADFAASTELTFGSLVQRVMTVPSSVRFHYGHPDVWNKRFIMYRGGVSKANKGLHVSEDVFGGYNTTLRGGLIKFAEFISVGKGRDMGFDSINGFEAKISAGNGEQVMSRDVYRLGTLVDFFRLMSWYHTGNGFFINTALTMWSVKVAAYSIAVLTLAGVIGDGISAAVTSLQIVQLGSFSILVYAFTVALESGLVKTVGDILGQMVAGSLFFFIFRAQTSAANFVTTMRYGGAAYVATGRGFLLTTLPFEQLWRLFGRSHMYFGVDLALLLILANVVRAASWVYLLPSWLVVVALLLGPFWFNPFAFETKKVKSEFQRWLSWMNKNGSLKDDNCWRVWHKKDMARARNDNHQQTDRFWLCLWMLLCTTPSFILALSAVNIVTSPREDDPGFHPARWALFGLVAVPTYAFAAILAALDYYYIKQGLRVYLRMLRLLSSTIAIGGSVAFLWLYVVRQSHRLGNVYILLYAMLQLLQALKILLLFGVPNNALCRMFVDRLFFASDLTIGFMLFTLRYVLSLLGIVNRIQGALLFNTAYARQYVFEQDMKGTELEAIVVEARRRQKQV